MKYLTEEARKLWKEIITLEFREVYIFLSASIIIYISIVFTSPSFYRKYFDSNWLNSIIYWYIADGLLMFLIPVLSIKLVLKEKLSDFGFTLGDKKFGLITFAIFFISMFITVWIVSSSRQFAMAYPQGGDSVRNNMGFLLIYELFILVYMLGWEFMWRGYMLFGLKKRFGYYSIFIQMIPFFILHKGKPEIELFASILAGIILGIQALRSRSFIYSWILHWLVMVSIDTISILRYNASYYNIFF